MEKKHTVQTKCRFCRRVFDSFNLNKVCNDCEKRMDDQFKIIRKYINENPDATIVEICDALDIPVALIKYFLKEERLLIKSKEKNLFLKCEECGKPVYSGRFCRECEVIVVRNDMKGKRSVSIELESMDREIAVFHLRKGGLGFIRPKDID